ncbi:MAG: universal stress protein [Acidimicrobiales bacterium]
MFDINAPDQSLLVPLRMAADARLVAPAALDIAQRLDVPIELFTAIGPDDDLDNSEERYLAAARHHFMERGVAVGVDIEVWEQPAWAVVEYCADRLVCMSTSASPFDALHFTGSFTATILARSSAPVFLVGPSATERDFGSDLRELVIAVDEDPNGSPVLIAADQLATRLGLSAVCARVAASHAPWRSEAGQSSAVGTRAIETIALRAGDSVGAALAQRANDSLLVIGTHARLGLDLIAAGSVLFDAVSVARRPVLAMGPNLGAAPAAAPDPSHPIASRRHRLG